MNNLKDIKSFSYEELEEYFKEQSLPAFRAKQIFSWLHEKKVGSFSQMTNISKDLIKKLESEFIITNFEIVKVLKSKIDGTRKYAFRLADDSVIESVFMKYEHGNSVCISSQVGCRMGCKFCASTIDGLYRNLTASEMLEQIYAIEKDTKEMVSNVVIMGSGEPLDNYDNVIRFLKLISDERGKNLSLRSITLSTCGLVPNIYKLADEKMPITLAISLHAPNDELRKKSMPIAGKYSIAEILDACDNYFEKTGRRISFEYSVISGLNDSKETITELAYLLKGRNCHVNLISVNPIEERDYKRVDTKSIENLKNILEKYSINVTIRRRLGVDIDSACGQLRRSIYKKDY